MTREQKRLGEILLEKGFISQEELKDALDEQKRTKEFLGSVLLKNNYIKEKELLQALSEQFNIPFISIGDRYIDWNFVHRFSPSLILDYRCFPLESDGSSITVAITNPLDAWTLKKAEEATRGFELRLALVSESGMKEAIRRYKECIRKKG